MRRGGEEHLWASRGLGCKWAETDSLASGRWHGIFGFMKSKSTGSLLSAICLIAACLSGCATPGQTYVSQHPELSAEQRKIFLAGKIANGDAVAGLTREQVRLIMGRDPTQFTKANGEDAWVWVREEMPVTGHFEEQMGAERGGIGRDAGGGGASQYGPEAASNSATKDMLPVRTTVYFQGNRATRAEVSEGRL
jgi:hypothetical protein